MNRSDARALIVGAGGLGSPAAWVLARGGVGTIAIADGDRVETANLHRQILHRTADVGRGKAESAVAAIRRLAPAAVTIAHAAPVTPENALGLFRGFDVVLDGSDSFGIKFLINDACVLAGVPFVHAAAVRWGGQLLPVRRGAPCYRCLFEEPPPSGGLSCSEAGIAGAVAGVIGALQAEAALEILDGAPARGGAIGDASTLPSLPASRAASRRESTLTTYDGQTGRTRSVCFRRNAECRACGVRPIAALAPAEYRAAPC